MQWSDVGKMIGTAAPVVGGLLLGPGGAAAGALLAKGLGVDATPDDVARVIQGDPEALLKIKHIESTERTELARMSVEAVVALATAEVTDRDSARKREIALHDRIPAILAIGVLALFIAVHIALLLLSIPAVNKDLLIGSTKTLENLLVMAFGYYLGTSLSSDKKTVMLSKTTGTAP